MKRGLGACLSAFRRAFSLPNSACRRDYQRGQLGRGQAQLSRWPAARLVSLRGGNGQAGWVDCEEFDC